MEMDAITPLDDYLKGWSARADISDDLWKLNTAKDGKKYYVPAHYVVLYLCYRTDLFQQAGLQPPKTFEEFRTCAKALTKGDVYGFGMRGGAGGFDNWGPFVLGGGASFDKGGMVTEKAIKQNEWYVNLFRQDKVTRALGADGCVPPDHRRVQGRPHRDGHPSPDHRERNGAGARRRQGRRGSGAEKPGRQAWTIFGDEFERDLLDLQEQGRGVQVDFVACPPTKAT